MEVSSHFFKQTLTYWSELGSNLCKTRFSTYLQPCRVALRYTAIADHLLNDCRCLDSLLFGLKEVTTLTEFHPDIRVPDVILSATSKLKEDQILQGIKGVKKDEIFKLIQSIELIGIQQEASFLVTHFSSEQLTLGSNPNDKKNVLDFLKQPYLTEQGFLEALSLLTSDSRTCIDEEVIDAVTEQLLSASSGTGNLSSHLSRALSDFYLQSFHDASGAGMIMTMLHTDSSEKCTYDDKIYCEKKLLEWLELRALMNAHHGLYQDDFSNQIYLLMSPLPFEREDGVDATEFVLHRLSRRSPDRFPSQEQRRALQAYLEDHSSEK